MTDFTKRLSVTVLASTYVLMGSIANGEAVSVDRQNEEIIARGGVVVTALTGTAVASVFAGGFKSISDERAKENTASFGKVSAPSSSLSQQVMSGTRPGDILKYEFIPSSAQALTNATEELTQAVARWTEQLRDLTFQRSAIHGEIADLKINYANRAPENRPRLTAAGKAQRLAELENDLADTLRLEKIAHTKLGEMNAQRLTQLGQKSFTEQSGIVSTTNRVTIEYPVLKNLSVNPDATISRVLALDATTKTRATPTVRIYKVNMKATNYAARNLKNAKRGLVGVAAGFAIMLEEITVGAIGEKLSENAAEHYAPATRIEPKATVQ